MAPASSMVQRSSGVRGHRGPRAAANHVPYRKWFGRFEHRQLCRRGNDRVRAARYQQDFTDQGSLLFPLPAATMPGRCPCSAEVGRGSCSYGIDWDYAGSCANARRLEVFQYPTPDAILAMTGSKFPKKFTSHDLRRTVATRLAESLADEGDKLVRRVLGHSDGSVTAIYNRYGYVRGMRRVLEQWANDLTSIHVPAQSSAPALLREVGLIGARATLA